MNNIPTPLLNKDFEFLINNFNNNKSYMFVLQNMHFGELPFLLINSINKYLEINPYDDISCLSINKSLPILIPNFAISSTNEITKYQYTIIATDIPTWQACEKSIAKNKFLFLYDISVLSYQKIPKDLIEKINNSGYNIFTRTSDHKKFLEKIGFKIMDKCCQSIDMKEILEVIHD